MTDILDQGVISFFDMEVQVFRIVAQVTSQIMSGIMERADEQLHKKRDTARYEVLDKREREIDTMFGGTVRFRRRYYQDRATGEPVFLLDEAMKLPARTRQSPGLRSLSVNLATQGSYRQTRDILEQTLGVRVMSHESIRQQVLATGEKLRQLDEEMPAQAEEGMSEKPRFIFVEVDGIHCHLQRVKRNGKKNIEIRMMYAHEGWEEHPDRKGKFRAVRLRIRNWDPGASDFEDIAGQLCRQYDIDKDTVVVICGDRASWIRKGIEYFGEATVLYQVDRFHILRDLRRLLKANPEGHKRVVAAIDHDPTGGLFMSLLAEEMVKLPSAERQKVQSLLNDLIPIADCICDYRTRLEALGIDTQELRALGATESRNSLFAARLKGYKKSWSVRGLEAMAHTLAAKIEGKLGQVLHSIFNSVAPLPGEARIKQEAMRAALAHLGGSSYSRSGNIPVKGSGVVRTGGLSRLFKELATGL